MTGWRHPSYGVHRVYPYRGYVRNNVTYANVVATDAGPTLDDDSVDRAKNFRFVPSGRFGDRIEFIERERIKRNVKKIDAIVSQIKFMNVFYWREKIEFKFCRRWEHLWQNTRSLFLRLSSSTCAFKWRNSAAVSLKDCAPKKKNYGHTIESQRKNRL